MGSDGLEPPFLLLGSECSRMLIGFVFELIDELLHLARNLL